MKKILVAYATRSGSTEGVAEAIAKTMREQGAAVDVLKAGEVRDIGGYGAVIVGSGIYVGKWLSDAQKFVERNKEALQKVPVAYFVVCGKMKDDTEKNRAEASAYSNPAKALVSPVDVGLFAGAIDYSRMNFIMRFMMKNMMEAPEGDFRNWDAIAAWARTVYPRLNAGK